MGQFEQTLKMLRFLGPALPVEQSMALFQQAQQQRLANRQTRQESRGARGARISDLINQGVDWAMEDNADPNQVAAAVLARGQAAGLGRKGLTTALSTLGAGTDGSVGGLLGSIQQQPGSTWDEDMQANFDDEYASDIQTAAQSGDPVQLQQAKDMARKRAQFDAQAAGVPWETIAPSFTAAMDSAALGGFTTPEEADQYLAQRQSSVGQRALSNYNAENGFAGGFAGGRVNAGDPSLMQQAQGVLDTGAAVSALGLGGYGAVKGAAMGKGFMGRPLSAVKGAAEGFFKPVTTPAVLTRDEFKAMKDAGMRPKVGTVPKFEYEPVTSPGRRAESVVQGSRALNTKAALLSEGAGLKTDSGVDVGPALDFLYGPQKSSGFLINSPLSRLFDPRLEDPNLLQGDMSDQIRNLVAKRLGISSLALAPSGSASGTILASPSMRR